MIIKIINTLYSNLNYTCFLIGSYKLLKDRRMDDVIINNISSS